MVGSPASSLSSIGSDVFSEDIKHEDDPDDHHRGDNGMPPSKRQRITSAWERRRSSATSQKDNPLIHDNDDVDISSDTSGDVPASPGSLSLLMDEDAAAAAGAGAASSYEQVTACKWDGCDAGDLGDMDNLVHHIHDVHIGTRQKKYACQWRDCNRKGMPHASGYALRAHMRSHTREKPFYCLLPECDRSFTRSDALAKHMRTVHETEALRPSDPVPKSHGPGSSISATAAGMPSTSNSRGTAQSNARLKLLLSGEHHQTNGTDADHDYDVDIEGNDADAEVDPLDRVVDGDDLRAAAYLANNGAANKSGNTFVGDFESNCAIPTIDPSLPPSQQFRLLRRHIHWAEQDNAELKAECDALEEYRRKEWLAKELLLNNVLEAEIRYQGKRRGKVPEQSKVEVLPEKELPLRGTFTPWYRKDSDGSE